jgi:hypothetical protein
VYSIALSEKKVNVSRFIGKIDFYAFFYYGIDKTAFFWYNINTLSL